MTELVTDQVKNGPPPVERLHEHHDLMAYRQAVAGGFYADLTLATLVHDAREVILNAPREKDEADARAMLLLELAYARLAGAG